MTLHTWVTGMNIREFVWTDGIVDNIPDGIQEVVFSDITEDIANRVDKAIFDDITFFIENITSEYNWDEY